MANLATKETPARVVCSRTKDESFSSENGSENSIITVDWEGPDDPTRPQNWSLARKWTIVTTNSLATFMVSFSSSAFSGSLTQVQEEFKISADVALLGISLYVLGFAFGPMVWGPASELYGKKRPLWTGYVAFCLFQVLSALSWSTSSLLVSRILEAIAGSSTFAIMTGMFVDFLKDPTSRGIAAAMFSMSVFCGPAAGPIVGSVVTAHLGWRWSAWITLICSVVFGTAAFLVTPETSETTILQRRAQRLRKKAGDKVNVVCEAEQGDKPGLSAFAEKYLTKPLRMFALEPILSILTVYMSFVYGIIYLTFELYPQAFVVVRGWSAVDASLSFFGILGGALVACIVLGAHSIYRVGPKFAETQQHVPERRLPPMILGSVLLPAEGIFWFSWTSFPDVPALAQVFSGVLIGSGSILSFMSGILYLTEVYLAHANSALAINNFIRSTFAAAFPYIGKLLIVHIGINIGGSILGGICVFLMPFPVILWTYGSIVRGWSKFAFQT
ncbi:MFS multidrug transporter [Apiospora arundinis]